MESSNKFFLENLSIEGNRIKYDYKCVGEWSKIFTSDTLSIEYSQSIDVCEKSVACIPLLCNILPLVWIFDAEVILEEIDEDFYFCINEVKKGYEQMYPMLEFKGTIKAKQIRKNVSEKGKVACMFSGGVDAFSTLIDHLEEKPLLATLWGADVDVINNEGWECVKQHIERVAETFELESLYARTNFRKFMDEEILNREVKETAGDDWWHGFQHGIGILGHMAPVAFCYGVEKIYIASSFTEKDKGRITCASDPSIDNYLRFSGCKIIHDGYEKDRQMKIKNICDFRKNTQYPIELRVCYETDKGDNCCKCEKCTRTMLAILAEKENPLMYGFKYTENDFEESMKCFHDIAYGEKYPTRAWRVSTYDAIQKRFWENYTKDTMPEYLEWFWDYNIKMLRATESGYYSQLYVDYGNGFSEKNSEKKPVKFNQYNTICFNLKPGMVGLRFDPCNVACKVKICEVKIDERLSSRDVCPLNAISQSDGEEVFFTCDSQYNISFCKEQSCKILEITYWCEKLNMEEIMRESIKILKEKNAEIDKKNAEIEKLKKGCLVNRLHALGRKFLGQ